MMHVWLVAAMPAVQLVRCDVLAMSVVMMSGAAPLMMAWAAGVMDAAAFGHALLQGCESLVQGAGILQELLWQKQVIPQRHYQV